MAGLPCDLAVGAGWLDGVDDTWGLELAAGAEAGAAVAEFSTYLALLSLDFFFFLGVSALATLAALAAVAEKLKDRGLH